MLLDYVKTGLGLLLIAQVICFVQSKNADLPKNYVTLGDRQYWFGSEVFFSAEEVALICNDLDMSMLSLEFSQEAQLVTEYISINETGASYWLSLALHNDQWLWTGSGQRAQFTDWDASYPTVNSTNQSRAYIYRAVPNWPSSAWRDHQGPGGAIAVCEEKTISRHTPPQSALSPQEREALLQRGTIVSLGGREYWIAPNITVKPNEADRICFDLNMAVMSLETQAEYQLIVQYLQSHNDTRGAHQNYVTSLLRYNEQWLWSGSGVVATALEWVPGYPRPDTLEQQCGYIQGENAWLMFHDSMCTGEARVVCEQRWY